MYYDDKTKERLFENAQNETKFNILNQQKLKKLRNIKAENKSNSRDEKQCRNTMCKDTRPMWPIKSNKLAIRPIGLH